MEPSSTAPPLTRSAVALRTRSATGILCSTALALLTRRLQLQLRSQYPASFPEKRTALSATLTFSSRLMDRLASNVVRQIRTMVTLLSSLSTDHYRATARRQSRKAPPLLRLRQQVELIRAWDQLQIRLR